MIRFLKESWKLPVIPFRCLPIVISAMPSPPEPSRGLLVGYEEHKVGILLDRAAFPQVAQLRPPASGPLFDLAVQLGDGDHRDIQFLREVLQAAADLRHLLGAVLIAPAGSGDELQVVHDEEIDPMFEREPLGFGPNLQHGQVRRVVDIDGRIREAAVAWPIFIQSSRFR